MISAHTANPAADLLNTGDGRFDEVRWVASWGKLKISTER